MESKKNFPQTVIAAITFIWNKIFRALRWYKNLWVRYTHNKYNEFVYKRGAAMAIGTLAVLIIIPTLISLTLQTVYYWTTHKKETIYLSQSEEIYPDNNIWGVRGCHTRQCDSDTSLYFRIRPSLFHHLWNLTHGGGIFLPDAIGSSVPPGQTQCVIISYGLRLRLMMAFDIYPNILKISCEGTDKTPQ